jgi:hypothetical protein
MSNKYVALYDILPIGKVLVTESSGSLVSQSSLENIVAPWKQAVDNIVQLYEGYFSKNLHSVYVRGSVSRGTAIEFFSDIDTLAILHTPLSKKDYNWANKEHKKLEEAYPFATAISHDFILYDEVIMKNNQITGLSFSYAFTIKIQSVCVYGDNLADILPDFKPNKSTALYLLTNLNFIFSQIKKAFSSGLEEDRIRLLCRWVSKILIRNAFLLVMEKEGVFTRDLYPCCNIFLKHFPDQELKIKKALQYAVNPISDTMEISQFIDSFGAWLRNKIEDEFRDFFKTCIHS